MGIHSSPSCLTPETPRKLLLTKCALGTNLALVVLLQSGLVANRDLLSLIDDGLNVLVDSLCSAVDVAPQPLTDLASLEFGLVHRLLLSSDLSEVSSLLFSFGGFEPELADIEVNPVRLFDQAEALVLHPSCFSFWLSWSSSRPPQGWCRPQWARRLLPRLSSNVP